MDLPRKARGLLVAVIVVALAGLVAGAAIAAAPAPGKWRGKIVDEPRSSARFTVKTGPLRAVGYKLDLMPVFCGDFVTGHLETRTIVIGRIPVRNGQMKKVKRFYDDGELIGRITIKGTFTSPTRVRGTAEWEDAYCFGEEDWRAHRVG